MLGYPVPTGLKSRRVRRPVYPLSDQVAGVVHSSLEQKKKEEKTKEVILQCQAPRETNPKGHWGPNHLFIKSLFLLKCAGS